MRIYFAGSYYPKVFEHDPRHILISYIHGKECFKCIEASLQYNFEVILDSGAFSAWNNGKVINRNDYLEFILEAKKRYPTAKVYPVNLDVIPGVQGEAITKDMVQRSVEKGWINYLWFKQNGVDTLHVFHEGEGWEWLNLFIKEIDYIGISPCNDSSAPQKYEWLCEAFDRIPEGKKTHGFAVTSKRLMKTFPWYSVDSASWGIMSGYGLVMTSFGNMYFSNRELKDNFYEDLVSQKDIAEDLLIKEFKQYPLQWETDNIIEELKNSNYHRRMINFFFLKKLEDEYNSMPNKHNKFVKQQLEMFDTNIYTRR